jgi:hypothetical protein
MRDVDAGGASHGSQHEATLYFGLGDASVASSVRVRWPSGAITEHGPLSANARHEIWEPPWLVAPARVRTGATADLEALLTAGASVSFSVTAGVLEGGVQDLGGGRFRQAWRAPATPGHVFVQVAADGVLLPARPRARVVGSDDTVISAPGAPARTGESFSLYVLPRTAEGTPLGPGRSVALDPPLAAAEDLGDGLYRFSVRPGVAGTMDLGASVDGERQAARIALRVVPAFDPIRSSVEASYALAAPGDDVLLRARVVDGADRLSPAVRDLAFVSSAGTVRGRPVSYAPGIATQHLELPDPAPEEVTVRALVAGIPIARTARIVVAPRGSAAPPGIIDGARSKVVPFHTAMPADGESMVRLLAVVRDVNGGFLPATPGTRFEATTVGTWRGPATSGLGGLASRCLVVPAVPGALEVAATVSGVRLGGIARVELHPAPPGGPVQDGCGGDSDLPVVPEEMPDAGASADGGDRPPDAGGPPDGGAPPDAGTAPPPDAGAHGPPDAGARVRERSLAGCAAASGAPVRLGALALLALLAFLAVPFARRS